MNINSNIQIQIHTKYIKVNQNNNKLNLYTFQYHATSNLF